tara:strand:- start:331 stop:831 length:501 start_codon:yes stop_codon:yes gene_type:complete
MSIKQNGGVFGRNPTFNKVTADTLNVVNDIDVGGNVVIGTAGKGIDFSATSGTGTSELLSDYEQGNWTPALGGTWTADPTSMSGTYTKVGRIVIITMSFSGGAKSSAIAGYFTGLPFAMLKNGTGVVNDTGINAQGLCTFANTDRVWVTENTLGTSNYLTGQYITA